MLKCSFFLFSQEGDPIVTILFTSINCAVQIYQNIFAFSKNSKFYKPATGLDDQELEKKVEELEQRLQLRQASKLAAAKLSSTSNSFISTELSDRRLQQPSSLVSEAEQAAFQQRLQEARRRAEMLAAKRLEEETNILRFVSRRYFPARALKLSFLFSAVL
jgi:ABC-type phosphate transport system auxiliary subunit